VPDRSWTVAQTLDLVAPLCYPAPYLVWGSKDEPAQFLEELIAEPGLFVLCEWLPAPGGSACEVCWIKEADGRDRTIRTADKVHSPVELPIPLWEEFVAAQLIRQDGTTSFENGTIYRPTLDGGRRVL